MEYSEGMGIEMPVWVIQTSSGKRTFNRKTNKLQSEVTEECVFNDPNEAKAKLQLMDFGYEVKQKRHYRDARNNRVW